MSLPLSERIGVLAAIFTSLVLAAPSGAAGAQGATASAPFYTRHLNPWVQVYGLPAAEGGTLVPPGRTDVRLVAEAGNDLRGGMTAEEFLYIDGETYRGTVALRHGWSPRVEVGFDLPVVGHAGGIFDGFIAGWHDFFGLPEGGRGSVRDNELNYHYVRDDVRTDLQGDTAGLGDIVLSGAYRLTAPGSSRQAALRLGIKLPTGDSERLLGSGSTDLSLRLAGTDAATLAKWNVTLFGGSGVVFLGSGDVLDDLRRPWVGTGNFGLAWGPLDWMAVKVQADAHTSVFRDSAFKPIDSWALQVVSGFSFVLPGELVLDAAVSENIIRETSPDVLFHLALRKTF